MPMYKCENENTKSNSVFCAIECLSVFVAIFVINLASKQTKNS